MKRVIVLLACIVLASVTDALRARPMVANRMSKPASELRMKLLKKCHAQTEQKACESSSCLWCNSKQVPAKCFHAVEYSALPKRVFQCTADKNIMDAAERLASSRANPSDPCEGLDQSSCNAKDECTWCKSAAVPSSCYTRAQAKFLPAAVFKCDKPPTLKRSRRQAAARARSRAAAGKTA